MKRLKGLVAVLTVILALQCGYLVTVFTDWIPPLSRLRDSFIQTAMSTMNHQWLATAFLPGDVIETAMEKLETVRDGQMGLNSTWAGFPEFPQRDGGIRGEADFFALFPELDPQSVHSFVDTHPEVLADGWGRFLVNEAGLEDSGTEMKTVRGDRVLAVDAEHGMLVIRVTGKTCRGALVLGKYPEKLRCVQASDPENGQTVGAIAEDAGALAAITGSGFHDLKKKPAGPRQVGASMSGGKAWGVSEDRTKRAELRSDHRLYVVDADRPFHPDCTDATEWLPALIVDGENVANVENFYTALNPRACIGQGRDGTVMLLGIEGRSTESLGCNAAECASILERYGAVQAMNLDGGTSAMLWYAGEPILRCSDPALPEGRKLPNAWVLLSQ